MAQVKYDYGRQSYGQALRKPDVHPLEVKTEASCARCRNLRTAGGETSCAASMPLDAASCSRFSDAGRQRDYFANFDYSGRFRR